MFRDQPKWVLLPGCKQLCSNQPDLCLLAGIRVVMYLPLVKVIELKKVLRPGVLSIHGVSAAYADRCAHTSACIQPPTKYAQHMSAAMP